MLFKGFKITSTISNSTLLVSVVRTILIQRKVIIERKKDKAVTF